MSESLMITRRNPSTRAGICQQVLKRTEELSHDQCNAHSWKLISLTLGGFGFIRASSIARKNCLSAALNEVKLEQASDRTLRLAIRGLLESRRFDEARSCIQNNAARLNLETSDKVFGNYLNLLRQLSPKFEFNKTVFDIPEERLYKDLIEQKTTALVATGEILSESGREIDSHATVARVKFRGPKAMGSKESAGSRCDITFYTEEILRSFAIKSSNFPNSLKFLENVQLLVLKERKRSSANGLPYINLDGWAPTFLTTATSGTLFIFDIMTRHPKKLKLFGFDLYSNRKIYSSELLDYFRSGALEDVGLPPNWFDVSSFQRNSSIIAQGFTAHDPKSDFLLLKNLYELSGLIDGTPKFLEIINLTADEYDIQLETMLGDW